jgi:hypothetical protein
MVTRVEDGEDTWGGWLGERWERHAKWARRCAARVRRILISERSELLPADKKERGDLRGVTRGVAAGAAKRKESGGADESATFFVCDIEQLLLCTAISVVVS